jgi:Cytosol aminopeptidase family, N-terminal domain
MKRQHGVFVVATTVLLLHATLRSAEQEVKELTFAGPNDVTLKLRMEGPYTADVPLQVVCYFKYTPDGARRMTGAPVELDKRLGGVIGALRQRGEFVGDALETLLITPPPGSIKAKGLLLIGLGDESSLSVDLMEKVGRVALREASRIGTDSVAFAPLIRDQGNTTLDTGDIESAVTRGALLAYDTEKRLQKEGLSKPFALRQWIAEAGPTYFDSTKIGLQKGIDDAKTIIARRPAERHAVAK